MASGLLVGGFAANAQYPGDRYDRDARYDRDGARYDRDGRYDRGDFRGLFERVRYDLDRAESGWDSRGGDRRRFNKVRDELNEFQGKLARGRFSRGELDDVIGSLQRVVNDNRLEYRDRDVLQKDLWQLREFRSRNGWR